MPLLIITFLLGIVFAVAAPAQDSYEATYKLLAGPLTVGRMERSFSIAPNGKYNFESKLWATGLASFLKKDELLETSTGTFHEGSFSPSAYTYVRQSKKKPRNIRMHFDEQNASIETIINGERLSAPLHDGLLDKLVYQAALMHDLRTRKSELTYRIADRGREKTYQPIIAEETVVDTKIGSFETVKVVRQRSKDKRRTVFWCAAELGYLPVRVVYRDKKGAETTAILTSYRRLDSTPDQASD